jgi:hypothetical protein
MDPFFTIVLATAIIILILTLTYLGIKMRYNKATLPFPPLSNACPDYWTVDASGCMPPANNVNNPNAGNYAYNGTCAAGNCMNFSDTKKFPTTCKTKTFVNANQIVWDGVSNFNGC